MSRQIARRLAARPGPGEHLHRDQNIGIADHRKQQAADRQCAERQQQHRRRQAKGAHQPSPPPLHVDEEFARKDGARKIVVRLFWGITNIGEDSKAFFCMAKEAAERGSVFLYSGHSRVGLLDLTYMGEQIGAPLELYDRPANRFVAGFIGSPAMNFLPGERIAQVGRDLDGQARLADPGLPAIRNRRPRPPIASSRPWAALMLALCTRLFSTTTVWVRSAFVVR